MFSDFLFIGLPNLFIRKLFSTLKRKVLRSDFHLFNKKEKLKKILHNKTI